MTYARPVTPELYAELISDLEDLKAHRNPWAASWLQILDTLEDEADRTAVLSALINGLPALYDQMRDLGIAALKTIARDAIFEDDFAPLEEVFVGPKPPSVPDHLGALFAPLTSPVAGFGSQATRAAVEHEDAEAAGQALAQSDELADEEPDFLDLPEPDIAGPKYAPAITPELEAELKTDAGIIEPLERIFDEEEAKLREVRDELRRARAEEE
jgi:hypothetical protein